MITWPYLLGTAVVIAAVLLGVYLVGRLHRRGTRATTEYHEERTKRFRALQNFLQEKAAYDLVDADTKTVPYIRAFIEIIQMSGTVDELRPIAEVYRHRRGFKNEWIGE